MWSSRADFGRTALFIWAKDDPRVQSGIKIDPLEVFRFDARRFR